MPPPAESIALAFTLVNSVRALFYVPQILAVARSVDGARDIALASWVMWVVNNLLGADYAVAVADDTMLALSFAASALMCALTIALTLAKRAQRQRAGSPVSRWQLRSPPASRNG
jgi:predicted branched-subunit amino acid permease